ncbi:MAG: SusC/RagA family TonB-linked outer membrane protein [Saprospiraceae bacterium]|nr:SusC/RagA family TonB-linked outer membrane protein [Candidatus Brachybacter algidus]
MKSILHSKAIALLILLCCFYSAHSQSRPLNGNLKDVKGDALTGATVLIKGTADGTTSDANGNFQLNIPKDGTSLLISYLGYKTKEVAVGAVENQISIILEDDAALLDEVVVIGFGSIRKANVTSAISSVSEKDLEDLVVAGADQALQGKVAGVTVNNNSGQPGAGISVRVRGITSTNGNEPLYVIDGVPILSERRSIEHNQLGGQAGQSVQSPLASLNPNDIESIDILKDASAQAIYGALAANGVVIINTKKGKAGKGKIGYDTYVGYQTIQKKLDLLDLRQYAGYYNSLIPEINNSGSGHLDSIDEFKNPSVLGGGTDWQDAIFQTGKIQSHQLSFSGGSGKTTYYTSLNYFDQTGIVIGSAFKRYSGRISLDHEVRSWLNVGMNTNLSQSNQRITLTDGSDAVIGIGLYNSPAAPVRSFDGEYATTASIQGNSFGNPKNPVALAALRDVRNVQSKVLGNVYGDIKFLKHFTLRNEFNYDFNVTQNKAFQPLVRNEQTGIVVLSPSRLIEERGLGLYWAFKTYLTFEKSMGKHWVNALIGHEAQESNYDQLIASRQNLVLNLESLNAGEGGTTQSITAGKYPWAMESYFGRVNYAYNDKYSLSASIRRDGSSSFGKNNKYGYFPAASVGWTISNEPFFNESKMISYAKLRLGVGSVGNSSTSGNNLYNTNIRLFSTAPFGAGGIPSNVGNPDLSWESVVTQNAGLDVTLFNKIAEVSVDVYKKVSTNMILQTQLPVYSGLGTDWNDINSPTTNAGEMRNTGIDIALRTYNISRKDFSWRSSVVFSHYKNELVALNDPTASLRGYKEYGNAILVTNTYAGGPVGTFFGFVDDGLFRTQAELDAATYTVDQNGVAVKYIQGLEVGENPVTGTYLGDARYKDVNGDGRIDDKDLTVIGDPNPDFTYGISNTFTYKDFDLSLFSG